ncbi:uncharacterized protein LOC128278465 [Anopheles cruzii]|uniref:uncharacterized protein LOC128278465 n=1 Tax=Anopheles cruzii TaxID=68878 RepID=UPI0022EC630C|nr:uncharacterized protein LOC128278465 [Anopheles cruzii]
MVHSEEKQWQMMFLFPIPEAVQDGIVYCQRSLRDFVKLHETLAAQINKLGGNQRTKARQYLKELEEEIVSIGGEQKILVGLLTENLRSFQLYVRVTKMVNIGNEMADGYVTYLLRRSMEMPAVPKKLPPGVTVRRSAAELAEHYSIENILKLYRDECGRKSKHPQWPSGSKEDEEKQKPTVSSQRPVTVSPSRSLLKRRQDRPVESEPLVTNVASRQERRPFEGIGKQQQSREQIPLEVKQKSVVAVAASGTPSKQSRKESIEVKVEYPEPKQQWPLPSGVWKPGSRGRPPNAAKRAAALLEATQKLQTKVPIAIKVPKPQVVVEVVESSNDSSGDEPVEMTAAYRQSRSNLQQALANLVGHRKCDEAVTARPMLTAAANLAKRVKPTTTTTSSGGAKLVRYSSSTVIEISSGSSPNSRSSSPSSADSFDRRSPVSDFPPIASEPPVPTPLSIYELEQPAFLKFFGLYTPKEVQALRERKRERKRRSCNSTERKDFHYGRFDYYEQQQRRTVSQRPVLYSPPVTVAKKRKALPPAPTASSSVQVAGGSSGGSAAGPSASFKHILGGLEDTSCFVCLKRGYTEELSSCMNCCNIYHIDCHEFSDPKASDEHLIRQRENLCPNCL